MARKRSPAHTAAGQPRRPRRIHAEEPGKLREPAGCPQCGASFRNGRWTWKTAAADSTPHTCPACERIASDYPAGLLHVGGGFAAEHRDDLVALIRGIEERERAEHPLKRVMAVADEAPGFVVTTTDAKLAETLGRAIQKAYAGRLESPPTNRDKENLVRVHWTRD